MKYTYIKNKNNKNNNKENNPKKLRNRTQKHTKISINKNNKTKLLHKTQKNKRQIGGSDNKHSNHKEKFEVHSLKNFDYDKYKISKGANIDWSSIGGPPPEPNCCIC
jgi:hypothetical protein